MIDPKYNVTRYISVFSNESEELVEEIDLPKFDLKKFQVEFGESNPDDPMYACYPIADSNVKFLEAFGVADVRWDFVKYAYFVEATALD